MAVAHTTDADAVLEYRRGEFAISTDRERLSLDVVHDFLTNCYWAKGIPRDVVARSIQGALCFGIYDANGGQVGFARVISDFATIAYVGDVFVLETHRGLGLGKWLMQCITLHPALQNLRRWIQDPSIVKPGSKMPAMGLSDPELTAVTAYLETLR